MLKIIRADLSTQAHADALITLMDEYACDPMGGGKGLSAQVKKHLAATLSAKNNAHVILAYINNEAVGLVTCIEGFSTFQCQPLLNIHDAIVKLAYRGQGILHSLFTEAEKIAIELGCCKMTLEVLEGNQPARRAYTKFGFSGYELDPKMGTAQFWEKTLES